MNKNTFFIKQYTKLAILASALILGNLSGEANAAVIIKVAQSGKNLLVYSTGGSLNLDTFTYLSSFTPKLSQTRFTLQNNNDAVYIGKGASDYYRGRFQGPSPTITTNINSSANTVTGAFYGAYFSNNLIFAPKGYSSGDPLPHSSATYFNRTFADWGLHGGDTFTWTWGTGASEDSITITAVPEPSSSLFVTLSLLTLTLQRRKIKHSPYAMQS